MDTYTIKIFEEEILIVRKLFKDIVKNPKLVDAKVFQVCQQILIRLEKAEKDIQF